MCLRRSHGRRKDFPQLPNVHRCAYTGGADGAAGTMESVFGTSKRAGAWKRVSDPKGYRVGGMRLCSEFETVGPLCVGRLLAVVQLI